MSGRDLRWRAREVQAVLDAFRPGLIVEGGDVKLVALEGGVVYVSLVGSFTARCRSKRKVLGRIAQVLAEKLPWVEGVKTVCPPPESQAR